MQEKIIISLILLFLSIFAVKTDVYAEEIYEIDENSFMEYKNATIDQYDNEYITETEHVLTDILVGEFVLTAYCPCAQCCGKETGITASGVIAQANHTIAADTSILPFGTEVYIDGQAYIVEDTGSAIKSNRIDIFFAAHSEALAFGKKTEKVYKKEYVEKEKTIVLKPVEFKEYMLVTGDLMQRKIAEHEWDRNTGNVVWKNRRGEILATRTKNIDGLFENRIEEKTYKDWERNRK